MSKAKREASTLFLSGAFQVSDKNPITRPFSASLSGVFQPLCAATASMSGRPSANGRLIDATDSRGQTVTRVESDWLISSRTCWYFSGTGPAVLPGYRGSVRACVCAWACVRVCVRGQVLALFKWTNFCFKGKLRGQLHQPSQP